MLKIALCLLILICASPGNAQSAYQPGFDYSQFPPIRHSVPFYRQDTMVWCWVAAAKMVADYFNWGTPSQCEMLEMQYGAPCCVHPAYCHRPGHINEIQALVQRFGGRASIVSPPANGFMLYDALRRGPLVLHTVQGGGHFVVAVGMRVVPSPWGPLGIVSINDPFVGRYDIEFPRLLAQWDAALVIY